MKTRIFLVLVIGMFILTSCGNAGEVTEILKGNETTLPDDLKGLQMFKVSDGCGNLVDVWKFKPEVGVHVTPLSSTTTEPAKLVDRNTGTFYNVNIIYQDDQIIVARK